MNEWEWQLLEEKTPVWISGDFGHRGKDWKPGATASRARAAM